MAYHQVARASDFSAERWAELDEAPPRPDGQPLALFVDCFVDRERMSCRRHPVMLQADWTVTTPHDLEAERIGVALGGYSSCLELVDHTLPAVRLYVQRQLRRVLPRAATGSTGQWVTQGRVDRCCASTASFASASAVAEHARSARHAAAECGARAVEVKLLGDRVLAVYGCQPPVPPPPEALLLVGTCVRNAQDLWQLWDAGLPPEVLRRIHALACDTQVPPPSFYVAVLTHRPDLAWVRASAALAPDREVHDWLARTETPLDVARPGLRGAWLGLGVSLRDIPVLTSGGYAPSDVEQLARGLAQTPTSAAAVLSAWVTAGCRPEVEPMISVCRRAVPGPGVVSRASVDRLVSLLRAEKLDGSREQLAFALTLCGSARLAAVVVSRVRSFEPEHIDAGLRAWEDGQPRRPRKEHVHA